MKSRMARSILTIALCSIASNAWADAVTYPTSGRIGMSPPASFELAPTFPGFISKSLNSSIVLYELGPSFYDFIYPELSDNVDRVKGLDLSPIHIDGIHPACRSFRGVQIALGMKLRKWVVLCRLPEFTADIVVNMSAETSLEIPDRSVEQALASIQFR